MNNLERINALLERAGSRRLLIIAGSGVTLFEFLDILELLMTRVERLECRLNDQEQHKAGPSPATQHDESRF